MSNTISVRLSENIAGQLDTVAKDTQRSKSFHVQRAIEHYLKEQADLEVAIERFKDPNDEVISLKQMREEVEV